MAGAVPVESTFVAGQFGTVRVYAPEGVPVSGALLVSGDEGWNDEAAQMANELRGWGALVAGIDSRVYLDALRSAGGPCAYPAAELESLGHAVQKRAGESTFRPPLLIGYGSGAALAYAAAVQAPAGTFAGVITLGYCATLPVSRRWCPGAGLRTQAVTHPDGVRFEAATQLHTPWMQLHGEHDAACSVSAAQAFSAGMPAAKFVLVPKAESGHYLDADSLPLFRDAWLKLVTASTERPMLDADVRDLPLVEVPAANTSGRRFAVLLTGDGGWAGLDRDLSDKLSAAGMPVVVLSTLKYFWTERQPEVAAQDLERIIRHYSTAWQKDQVLLIGYSFGANVLPFIVRQLSPASRDRITAMTLIAPATHTGFEIRVADWLPGSTPVGHPIAPEMRRLSGVRTLCLFGSEDGDSLCPHLPAGIARSVSLPGGHHFNDDVAGLAREILAFSGP